MRLTRRPSRRSGSGIVAHAAHAVACRACVAPFFLEVTLLMFTLPFPLLQQAPHPVLGGIMAGARVDPITG